MSTQFKIRKKDVNRLPPACTNACQMCRYAQSRVYFLRQIAPIEHNRRMLQVLARQTQRIRNWSAQVHAVAHKCRVDSVIEWCKASYRFGGELLHYTAAFEVDDEEKLNIADLPDSRVAVVLSRLSR